MAVKEGKISLDTIFLVMIYIRLANENPCAVFHQFEDTAQGALRFATYISHLLLRNFAKMAKSLYVRRLGSRNAPHPTRRFAPRHLPPDGGKADAGVSFRCLRWFIRNSRADTGKRM